MNTRTIPKTLLFVLVVATIFFRFEQYEVEGKYTVYSTVPCDPETSACFVYECAPDDPECVEEPYLKVEAVAGDAPACLAEVSCDITVCDGSESCFLTECAEDTLEEGEVCLIGEETV